MSSARMVRAFVRPVSYRGGTPCGGHDGDSSAPGRLVVCHRRFSFGRPDTAALRSAPEFERFAGLSATARAMREPDTYCPAGQ